MPRYSDTANILYSKRKYAEKNAKFTKCYEPQSLDKIIIKLFVNEFGKLPDSFRLA